MKPAASFWSYAPPSSSNVDSVALYSDFSALRPTTMTLPLYSLTRTTPLTLAEHLSIAACSISRSGENQKPLYRSSAYRGMSSSFWCDSPRSKQTLSIRAAR